MAAERWAKIQTVYREVEALSGDARGRYLDQACIGDPSLRAEVEALLRRDSGTLGNVDVGLPAQSLAETRGEGDPVTWSKALSTFERMLGLQGAERELELARLAEAKPALHHQVVELVAAHEEASRAGFLSTRQREQQLRSIQRQVGEDAEESLYAGTKMGPWQITRLAGRGGMGEVYEAQRADGAFEMRAAVKLLKRGLDTAAVVDRFNRERRILAQLDHPNIAHVLDAGVAEDGRPFLVMEYVDGQPITEYVRNREVPTAPLIQLMITACEAVQAAHAKQIIHRDLKPSNVLVTPQGQIKLLDFGIAKVLAEDNDSQATRLGESAMTPAYAAPEQLLGAPATPATDVYALGCILYQLLVERLPHARGGRSTHDIAKTLDKETIERPSTVLRKERGRLPEPIRLARLKSTTKDLDLIVLKALHPEAQRRYADAQGVAEDLQRLLDQRPVLARPDSVAYRIGRFVQRNRALVAATAAVILALAGGLTASLWEAHAAVLARNQATHVTDFLLNVFKASDPRIASDRPRGQITAKELLDISADRVEAQFVNDPDTEIQLLGTSADIYHELNDSERFFALHGKHLQLVKARFGELSAIYIEDLLRDANVDDYPVNPVDPAVALKRLDQIDQLITQARLDQSVVRARYWMLHGEALIRNVAKLADAENDTQKALTLFERYAPQDPDVANVLNTLSIIASARVKEDESAAYERRAISVTEHLQSPDNGSLMNLYGNFAVEESHLQNFGEAERAYQRAEEISRKTYGETDPNYWFLEVRHAEFVHQYLGERQRSLQMFQSALSHVPQHSVLPEANAVRVKYAESVAAEGRSREAIPLLESALFPDNLFPDMNGRTRARDALADAYDAAERIEDARHVLDTNLKTVMAQTLPGDYERLRTREHLGRFLLEQGDSANAEADFREVLSEGGNQDLGPIALAYAGMARLSIAKPDAAAALDYSAKAVDMVPRIRGPFEVRWGPMTWLVRSQALRLSGDRKGALEWAQKALSASHKYDDPSARSIRDAEAAVRAASYVPTSAPR
jgi:serine/threonine-protein kinase